MPLDSGLLFAIAKDAARRANQAKSRDDDISKDVAIAVVFAAASLEGFINDLGPLVGKTAETEREKAFVAIAKEAEENHAQPLLKFQLASFVLLGRAMEKGAQPYQNLDLLFKMRNDYVHLKPEDKAPVRDSKRQVVKRLQPLGALRDLPEDIVASWVDHVATPKTAELAVTTAAEVVRYFTQGTGLALHLRKVNKELGFDQIFQQLFLERD